MRRRSPVRDWIEYVPASLVLKSLGLLPRRWAIKLGLVVAVLVYYFWIRLRKVGLRNLELIFPESTDLERRKLLKRAFKNLGRLLGEFSQFPKLNRDNVSQIVVYDGLENYTQALAQGRGVLILTAHFGAWELSSFAHSLYGYPMHFLVRRLDNPRLDRLIEQYRTLGGNRSIDKSEAARRVLTALRRGEAVGILMDLNTQPHEGVFCDFFGIPACTSPIISHFALRTDAAVVPGFLVWDEEQQIHRLHFEPPVELVRTGDQQRDLIENTERLNKVIESFIRRHPDQWLWVHKRWQTRPPGEPNLYE
jgi:KDO2-lipid IV(A) lauroyltransferase